MTAEFATGIEPADDAEPPTRVTTDGRLAPWLIELFGTSIYKKIEIHCNNHLLATSGRPVRFEMGLGVKDWDRRRLNLKIMTLLRNIRAINFQDA